MHVSTLKSLLTPFDFLEAEYFQFISKLLEYYRNLVRRTNLFHVHVENISIIHKYIAILP